MIIKGYWGEKNQDDKISIDSAGHIFTFHGREIDRPNGRPNYLLLYIYRGEARFFFKTGEVTCSSGDFLLYAPGEPQHHIYEANTTGEFYYIHFSTDNKSFLNLLDINSSTPYHSIPSSEICDIFEGIISELQNKKDGYKTVTVADASKLFVKFNRLINKKEVVVSPGEIESVIQHINKNYSENLTLDDYAKMCELSKFHFLHTFKAITGVSPLKYRANIRINHAKDLLLFSHLPVNKISDSLGYSTPEYFSQSFKRSTGLSPQDFRKQSI